MGLAAAVDGEFKPSRMLKPGSKMGELGLFLARDWPEILLFGAAMKDEDIDTDIEDTMIHK